MNVYWKDRRVWAWSLYDFANSAFATTVLAVVFNVYFVQRVVPPEGVRLFSTQVPGESLWGYVVSFSMALTFVFSPLLGAVADHSGTKKKFLTFFWLVGSVSSAGLFFVKPGDVALAVGLFIIANLAFASANVFYNAFLPELGQPGVLGRISGMGWAVGYLGGGLCLALNLLFIKSPHIFGLSTGEFLPVRASFLSVGIWWLIFGLPLLRWLPETAPTSTTESLAVSSRKAFRRLIETFRNLRNYRNLFVFLLAYLVYNDGIETVILMASVFGAQALGMPQDQLVMCFLMIQAVAFVGALAFGWLADRLRHKKTIAITLAVYVVSIFWAYRMETAREFWYLGVVVGLVLGGSQAASRSLMALLTPAQRSAEFFSFYGVAGKLTSVFGPLVFGLVSQWRGVRAGVLSLLVFFIVGGILLLFVREGDEETSRGR